MTYNCLKVNKTSLFTGTSHNFSIICPSNTSFMEVSGLGFATTTANEAINDLSCRNNAVDMPLDLGYCGDNLFNWIATNTLNVTNCSRNSSSCLVILDKTTLLSNCPQSSLKNNIYFTYSCYGKDFNENS